MAKMPFSSCILRNVLFERKSFCCLCYNSIGEVSFDIYDEVFFDDQKAEVIYEILSTVIGDGVLDNIPTQVICQKCIKTAIQCYKFIQQCKTNIDHLLRSVESLQVHTEHINQETHDYKSLFLDLDTSNFNVDFYYDKNRNSTSPTLLINRFQRLKQASQEFFIEFELEPHCIANYKKRTVKKNRCSNLLQSLSQLADIVQNEDDVTCYKCKTCMKLYPTAIKLKQHFLRVHAPKDYKCSQCSRSFGSNELLNRHTKECHCFVVCSHCGKGYTNIYSLRHHERSHNLRFVCQNCGKIYKGKQAFNNHNEMKLCKKMRRSNAEAKLICNYCNKKYSQKTALSVHIRLEHEGGKALVCDWCGKKFSSTSKLKDHIVKHTKQKNFECELCGGRFVTKTSLLYHTRIHTGEKPYKCEYCEMTFLSASRRSEHVKRNHATSDLECDICHGKYKGNTCLRRHKQRHSDVKSTLYHKPPPMS